MKSLFKSASIVVAALIPLVCAIMLQEPSFLPLDENAANAIRGGSSLGWSEIPCKDCVKPDNAMTCGDFGCTYVMTMVDPGPPPQYDTHWYCYQGPGRDTYYGEFPVCQFGIGGTATGSSIPEDIVCWKVYSCDQGEKCKPNQFGKQCCANSGVVQDGDGKSKSTCTGTNSEE